MKTFKLKSLNIIETEHQDKEKRTLITLIDGLAINREEQDGSWLIEAFVHSSYYNYFKNLKNQGDQLVIQVKISKETNDPALFVVQIIKITKIGDNMNVLFDGKIIDQRKTKLIDLLSSLMEQGFEGEELIHEFEKALRQN